MDKVGDPKVLHQVLSGGLVVDKSEIKEISSQESERLREQFSEVVDSDNLSKLDAALDSLLK